jgi:hypothetical protein
MPFTPMENAIYEYWLPWTHVIDEPVIKPDFCDVLEAVTVTHT